MYSIDWSVQAWVVEAAFESVQERSSTASGTPTEPRSWAMLNTHWQIPFSEYILH